MLLEPGDMILTGTPAGSDFVKVGDLITAGINQSFLRMNYKVVNRK